MRNIVSSIANIAMIAGTVLFTAGMPAPSIATENHPTLSGWDFCWFSSKHAHCKKTNLGVPSDSTELFGSVCNGEVGFWDAIPMPNGKVFCVARSTMDFYHNGTPSTCTKAKIDKDSGDIDRQRTFNGACKTHSEPGM